MLLSFISLLIIVFIFGKYYNGKSISKLLDANFAGKADADMWKRNPQIAEILNDLGYIRSYNKGVFDELKGTVGRILTMYYFYIGGRSNRIHIDDFSHEKIKLSNAYEEISMNIPNKYHKRTRRLFIKLKSSKSPIKISLMNNNLSFL